MRSKLTLRLDKRLIGLAKKIAKERGKSLSQMVEDYFRALQSGQSGDVDELTPTVKSLKGSLKGSDVGEKDYKKYLVEKYL